MNVNKQIDWATSHIVKDSMRLNGFGELSGRDKALVIAMADHLKSMIDPDVYVVTRGNRVEKVSEGVEEIDMDTLEGMGPEEAFDLYIRLQDLGLNEEAQEVREQFAYEWSEWND